MRALLLVDHGSRRAAANEMLAEVASLVKAQEPELPVYVAHMELAEPTIAQGLQACVDGGATAVVVVPYFLSHGRHVTEDVPRLVAEAAACHPGVSVEVAPPLGLHPLLAELVLHRAGLRK
ncbi:MAG: CbiX/SirB N-terminal domain-containing protein [Myxococcota bacterium]